MVLHERVCALVIKIPKYVLNFQCFVNDCTFQRMVVFVVAVVAVVVVTVVVAVVSAGWHL